MLSLIIPTFNEERYLPLLLESIKSQNFTDYEIIVADAGSRDKTVEIAKQYGCRVVKGGLLPAGRNRGAEAANGDVFLFLDSDVILTPFFLAKAIEEFRARKLGIATFLINPKSDRKIDKFWFGFFNFYTWLTQKFSAHSVAAIMASREAHNKIGGFDEEIVFVEDYSYAKAASKVSRFGIIKIPFFVSVRRYDKDGRFNVYAKYALAELHVLFLGPVKSNIFNYKFGHYDSNES
jgi:glycosyltransferase involved in cell wall biosynthesis